MAIVVPNVGEEKLLRIALGVDVSEDFVLHLFTNNVTPAETDTIAQYTELTAGQQAGYAAKTLTKASWTVTVNGGITTAGAALGAYAQQVFTLTGSTAVNVYGYYVTNNAGTVLLWSETFAAPFAIPIGGGTINVTPRFELS